MKRRMHKGFTLVELLIVVAILGTLAASMMLASKDASPSAKAKQVATDLKTIAVGVSLYLADSADVGPTLTYFNAHKEDYLFGTDLTKYTIAEADGKWTATYDVELAADVLAKLNDIKDSVGVTVNAKKASMRVK